MLCYENHLPTHLSEQQPSPCGLITEKPGGEQHRGGERGVKKKEKRASTLCKALEVSEEIHKKITLPNNR